MKLSDILAGAWAITPEMFAEINRIYALHLGGDKIDIKSFEAQTGLKLNNERKYMTLLDSGQAIINIHGVISKRANMFMDISGGVSSEIAMDEFKSAMENTDIHTIILSLDSPGGTADGAFPELIKSARGIKTVIALVDDQAASQAYWLASGASKIYIASNTAITGSIGVIMEHKDNSGQQAVAGSKVTQIFAGKYKAMASSNGPLTAEGAEFIQSKVDYMYSLFVDTVAENRGLAVSDHEQWANGDFFIGQQAIDAGLVDGIKTLDEILAETGGGVPPLADSAGGVPRVVAVKDIEKGQAVMASDIKGAPAVAGVVTEPKEAKGQKTMTRDEFKTQHPDAYKAIHDDAFKAGVDSVNLDDAKAEGAKAETQRVADVRAKSIPGFEAQIEAMVADGKTTGDQAAARLITAQQDALKDKGADVSKDAADLIQASAEPVTAPVKHPAGSTEAIDAAWDTLSVEAQGSWGTKDAFSAYTKNEHKVGEHKGKGGDNA